MGETSQLVSIAWVDTPLHADVLQVIFKVQAVHRNKWTRLGLPGSLSASLKIHMMSPAPKGKQPKPDRDSVIQAGRKKEACSPHNFRTSHVLRTQTSVKHRKPKPFPKEPRSRQMRGAHGVPRARAGVRPCAAGSAQGPNAMETQRERFN